MALSMMIPGLFAGALQEAVGYPTFFLIVIAACSLTYIVTAVGYPMFFLIVIAACSLTYIVTATLKIDPEFGKKKQE